MISLQRTVLSSLLMLGLIPCEVFAYSKNEVPKEHPAYRYFGALSVGPVWQRGGDTQTFNLTPEILKSYVADRRTRALPEAELFFGVQQGVYDRLWAQWGLALAATNYARLSGNIWDEGEQQFNNYEYQYKIKHLHAALKAKLFADLGYAVMPWVSGSVGVAANKAYGFKNKPIIFEAIENSNFSANVKSSFTYTVGLGLQKIINQNWQVGAGYEFSDWGKSRLGRAAGQTLGQGLALNHLYTNGLMFNVTYVK